MIERQLAAQFALSGAHLGQAQLVQYPAFGVENSSQNMGRKGFAGAVLRVKGIAHVAIDHGGPKFGPGRSDKAHLQAQSGTACPQARGEGIGPIITSTAGDRLPVRCGEKDQYIAGKGIGQFDLFGAGVRGRHRLDDHVGAVGLGAVCMGGIGRIAPHPHPRGFRDIPEQPSTRVIKRRAQRAIETAEHCIRNGEGSGPRVRSGVRVFCPTPTQSRNGPATTPSTGPG